MRYEGICLLLLLLLLLFFSSLFLLASQCILVPVVLWFFLVLLIDNIRWVFRSIILFFVGFRVDGICCSWRKIC